MPDVAAAVGSPAAVEIEAELVRRMVVGDRAALRDWFEAFQNSVYSFVYFRVGGHESLAADVTQTTFMKGLERLSDFDPKRGDMVNWLRYLSRNCIRDALKQHRRGVQLQAFWDGVDDELRETLHGIDDETLPEQVVAREETRQLVGMALANMPSQYREVLEAKYMRDESIQAIATARATSIDGVKSMLRRARQTFRDCFLTIAKMEVSDV